MSTDNFLQRIRDDAQRVQLEGACIRCKTVVVTKADDGSKVFSKEHFFTFAGEREYAISGCCEKCFDSMFSEE